VTRVATGAILALLMAAEAWWSARHEARLRARGAVEPAGDVYPLMQVVYPGGFLAMALEGWLRAPSSDVALSAGLGVLLAAKALKYWAIATLGERWCFRVLVPPGAPHVTGGPYRWLAHPNYVAVVGELVGVAMTFGAPVTGMLATVGFGALLRRRIRVEEMALDEGNGRP
jgi:methyltransferase